MATLPFFAAALLAICMVIPTVLSLQCYECTSHPQLSGGTSCSSSNVTIRTCPLGTDRCMTMKYILSPGIVPPQPFEQKNCSSSLTCDPQSNLNLCKLLGGNSSLISNCTLDCCQGDLCNMERSTSMPTSAVSSTPSVVQSTTPKPSRAVLGLAANLSAILLALVLPKIVGIN